LLKQQIISPGSPRSLQRFFHEDALHLDEKEQTQPASTKALKVTTSSSIASGGNEFSSLKSDQLAL
jgi:hypothetical protein